MIAGSSDYRMDLRKCRMLITVIGNNPELVLQYSKHIKKEKNNGKIIQRSS